MPVDAERLDDRCQCSRPEEHGEGDRPDVCLSVDFLCALRIATMLRPTLPADTPALLAAAEGTDVFYPHEIETLEEVLADFHREGEEYGHLALTWHEADVPAGLVYLAPVAMTDRTWELWWILVSKELQGRGTGRRLLELAESEVRQRAGRLLLIETSSLPHYEATRRFYRKNGYAEVARVPDFYRAGDDKLIYAKTLGDLPLS